MPRYFLHMKDRLGLTQDPEGEELDDLAAAQQEAAAAARDLMAECLRKGEPLGVHREVVIAGQNGDTVATVSFASALPAENEPPGCSIVRMERHSLRFVEVSALGTFACGKLFADQGS